jgi:cytosine/adenosine deaminase-related metal-dependent hydrolase
MFVTEAAALRARIVFPVSSPPIDDGLVCVREGRIVAIGRYGTADKYDLPVTDLGDVALLPGLVNAHTHLEFSLLERPLDAPRANFSAWIRAVIEHRRERTYSPAEAIAKGLEESRRAQIALVGEIASEPWPVLSKAASNSIASVVFREILGLAPERMPELLEIAESHLQSDLPSGIGVGLSPHAPYTVSPQTIERIVQLAAHHGATVAMHLAETTAELELLASHSGPLHRLLVDLGAWRPEAIPRGIRPLDYLRLLSKAPRALVIHGNYLTTADIRLLGERAKQMSVVYCPRTHAFFGHDNYPLAQLLSAGVPVALGTDSRASNPDLDLWKEALFAASRFPEIAPAQFLWMATLGGAAALGRDAQFGSIEPGKRAAFTTLPASGPIGDDSHQLLFEAAG